MYINSLKKTQIIVLEDIISGGKKQEWEYLIFTVTFFKLINIYHYFCQENVGISWNFFRLEYVLEIYLYKSCQCYALRSENDKKKISAGNTLL